MTTVRERRHRDTLAQLTRAIEQRDAVITKLVKLEARIKTLRRQAQRYEKLAGQPPAPKAAPKPPAMPVVETVKASPPDEGIPDFLKRKKDGEARDAAAKAEILAEQAERKKTKAHNRIGDMKAKQRGDTKRMPLTGKAALEAIRQG